ncbi:MAG: FapA family protein [Candidatus Jordarchaeaceae archaeon]
MPKLKVDLSEDEMTAYLTITAEANSFPGEEEIEEALSKSGVVFGIDYNVIREIVNNKKSVFNVPVAYGRDRHKLEQNQLIWYIDLDPYNRPKITTDGRADFKELKTVELVFRGQEIVSMVPIPTTVCNKKVTGEEFQVNESYLQHICGQNLRLTEDGLTLISEIDGCIFWKNGKLNVDSIYKVEGDVDYHTGNIKFDGPILIEGDVRTGFKVHATGSIFVNGNVEGAEIYSEKGDIIIKSGILGKGKARIVAGGNLHCHFIQDAIVGVKKDVIIDRYAINASISAGGSVYLLQNEGLIRGGKVFADRSMRVMEVGSPQNIPTHIGLSGKEFAELDAKVSRLFQREDDLKAKYSKLSKKIEFLNLLKERLGSLTEEKQRDLENVIKELAEVESELNDLEKEKEVLLAVATEADKSHNIEVYRILHKGVYITIGDREYINEAPLFNVRIYRRGSDIMIDKCGEENEL